MLNSFLPAPWTEISCAAALLVLLLWFCRYFRAMAPKKGTLEWIAMTVSGGFLPLPRFSLKSGRWQALFGAALLGAAVCPARLLTLSLQQWPQAAVSAGAALLFCLLLLFLFDGIPAALCGTALLLSCGLPSLPLLAELFCLLLFFLFLTAKPGARRLLFALLLSLAFGAAALLDPGFRIFCVGILAVTLLSSIFLLQNARSLLLTLLEVLGLALLLAAALFGAQLASARLSGSAWDLPAALTALSLPAASLPTLSQLPMLMPLLAAPLLLLQAGRRKDSRCLLGGLLGLSALPLCFFGAAELAAAGGLLCLSGTLQGGWDRGAKAAVLLTACLLILSILLTL